MVALQLCVFWIDSYDSRYYYTRNTISSSTLYSVSHRQRGIVHACLRSRTVLG